MAEMMPDHVKFWALGLIGVVAIGGALVIGGEAQPPQPTVIVTTKMPTVEPAPQPIPEPQAEPSPAAETDPDAAPQAGAPGAAQGAASPGADPNAAGQESQESDWGQ